MLSGVTRLLHSESSMLVSSHSFCIAAKSGTGFNFWDENSANDFELTSSAGSNDDDGVGFTIGGAGWKLVGAAGVLWLERRWNVGPGGP